MDCGREGESWRVRLSDLCERPRRDKSGWRKQGKEGPEPKKYCGYLR